MFISSLDALGIRFKRTPETDSMPKNIYGKNRGKKKTTQEDKLLCIEGISISPLTRHFSYACCPGDFLCFRSLELKSFWNKL